MKPGSLLYSCKPYAHTVLASQRGLRCEQCLKTVADGEANSGEPLRRCTACSVVYYCSVSCQREAWTYHKFECKCFKRMSPRIPTESVLLLLKLLQRQKRGDEKSVSETIWGRERVFTDLVHHMDAIKEDEKRLADFIHVTQTLKVFVGEGYQLPPAGELLELFGRMVVNTFSVCDGEMRAIGVAIYLGASVLDHSCRPSAVVVMEGAELQIRNVVDVTNVAMEAYCDELRISYIDQLTVTEQRRDELREQYYFTCDCPMCSDKKLDSLMRSAKCPQPDCGGHLVRQEAGLDHVCSTCNASFPPDSDVIRNYTTLLTTTKTALSELEDLKKRKESEKMLSTAEELLKQQENLFHKMNVYRVKVLDKAMDGCIDTKSWEKALKYALATVDAYKHYYHQFHPNVGVQLLKIGKLQLYLKHLEAAATSLQEAESILSVTHGTDHSLYKKLAVLLDQCSEERRVDLELTRAIAN